MHIFIYNLMHNLILYIYLAIKMQLLKKHTINLTFDLYLRWR